MSCFPCFSSRKRGSKEDSPPPQARDISPAVHPPVQNNKNTPGAVASNSSAADVNNTTKTFTFRELASATKNFRQECLLSEGGIGRVFKGTLQSSGQVVAVRQLDRSATQGSKEFQVEVSMLSLLHHPNLVQMIGYCADGDQRLLVYEYLPSGSLRNHLFGISEDKKPLDWLTRMKIALGIAEGLEYLHENANPPIIYRTLKSSNVLLDEKNFPKLSEYGLAKLLQSGNKMNVPQTDISAYGYCAPECERHGEVTPKSDVYSFGVVLLELITGRRAFDSAQPTEDQNLVNWAKPFFRDPSKFPEMADPLLRRDFSITSLNQAVGVASMSLQEEPSVRPLITDVVAALSFLAMAPPDAPIPARLVPILSSRVGIESQDVDPSKCKYDEEEEEEEEVDDKSQH